MNYYGRSHTGLKRKNNQDSFCLLKNAQGAVLGLVCDGIGGGNAGDIASRMAVSHIRDSFLHTDVCMKSDVDVKHWLKKTIQEANDLIFTQASASMEQQGMGTTVVGVICCCDKSYVFNAGDSRTYALYKDDFLCLTEDHSYVADLLKKGEVSEEQARRHPNRNMLTNAVGIWDHVRVDIHKIKNDYRALLICSDGLHGYVSEVLIRHVLESDFEVQAKVDLLVQAALDAGGYDNITILIMEQEKEDGHEEGDF